MKRVFLAAAFFLITFSALAQDLPNGRMTRLPGMQLLEVPPPAVPRASRSRRRSGMWPKFLQPGRCQMLPQSEIQRPPRLIGKGLTSYVENPIERSGR